MRAAGSLQILEEASQPLQKGDSPPRSAWAVEVAMLVLSAPDAQTMTTLAGAQRARAHRGQQLRWLLSQREDPHKAGL